MQHQKRSSIASGIVLILIGAILLVARMFPGLRSWFDVTFSWPMIIVFIGFGLLIIGLVTGESDMAIPACIVGGIGGILYFQNAGIVTWQSWAYLWTLIPGFAGVGTLLAGLIKWKPKQMSEGLESILVSIVLLTIFGSLMGNIFGQFPLRGYLPYVLIVLGVFLFIRALVQPAKRSIE